jgi:hypothetical protein
MDYNDTYTTFFNNTINRTEKKILAFVKDSKKNNTNFLRISDEIKNQLGKKEKQFQDSLIKIDPELYKSFKNRFRDYDSDYLESFFEHELVNKSELPSPILRRFVALSGIYEGLSRAIENFPNSDEFLKVAYKLDKNYEYYTLNFSQNENPIYSKLFNEMKKEFYEGFAEESNWEAKALLNLKGEEKKEKSSKLSPTNKELEKFSDQDLLETTLKEISPEVKLFLIRQINLLKSPINKYLSLPELMKLLRILDGTLDSSIFQKHPSNITEYRKLIKGLEFYGNRNTKNKIKSDTIKILEKYDLKRFKDYVLLHSK